MNNSSFDAEHFLPSNQRLYSSAASTSINQFGSELIFKKYDGLKAVLIKIEGIVYNNYTPQSKLHSLAELLEEKSVYEFKWDDWFMEFCESYPKFNGHASIRFINLGIEDRKIICMLYVGYSSSQIADKLCLSPKSVETRKYRFIKKYGIKNQSALRQLLSTF